MDISYEHIKQLYLEKLSGTISEEDESLLRDLLQNSEARSIWDVLEEENKILNADAVLAGIDSERELEQWKKRVGRETATPRGYSLWRWSAVASFVIGLGITYYLWQQNLQEPPATTGIAHSGNMHVSQAKTISLILGNGESVPLTKGQSQVFALGDIRLENSGNQLQYQGDEVSPGTLNTLFVPFTEDYAITLSDGTKVFLNSDTELRFPFYFGQGTREVFVKGEAYFEVAKNTRAPFIVHTPLAAIQVTGTRFNINTYEEGYLRASLVEGAVSVLADGLKPLSLTPGTEAVYNEAKGFSTHLFDESEVLSWREGSHYFHKQRLGELSGIITRWFDTRVIFEKESLADYPVSGLLEKGRLPEFLADLQATSGISYTLKDNVLYLK